MRVPTTDGLQLAVTVSGQGEDAPAVLCVHGYPDNATLWDGPARWLGQHYRVVRYDVRGAGDSEAPRARSGYLLPQLADDLATVAAAVSPFEPVHLLAHDWGSIQAWHAVTEPRLRRRFASYTSISGPCLDHVGYWLRGTWRKGPRGVREGLTQLLHSWYTLFFHVPWVPELGWHTGLIPAVLDRFEPGIGVPSKRDGINGLELYRANMRAHLREPRPRRTDVPVQVLSPREDAYVGRAMQAAAARWSTNFRLRRVDGRHWIPRSAPELVASHVQEFVEENEPRRRSAHAAS